MKWLTNIYDPRLPDAKLTIMTSIYGTREQAWKKQQEYLKGKIIGKPKASAWLTVEEMIKQNLVGVYLP